MILVDLNGLLDVIQQREPHYRASAAVLEEVVRRRVEGGLPAHGLTTVHYLVRPYQDGRTADGAVDWLLRYFTILGVGQVELVRARGLGWPDFEDAVVAAVAEASGFTAIVTRNAKDFAASPVEPLMPEEYLASTV